MTLRLAAVFAQVPGRIGRLAMPEQLEIDVCEEGVPHHFICPKLGTKALAGRLDQQLADQILQATDILPSFHSVISWVSPLGCAIEACQACRFC